MSRRKQSKPRHLDTEEDCDETNPNDVRGQRLISVPGSTQLTTNNSNFDEFDASMKDRTSSSRILSSDSIPQMTKGDISLRLFDHTGNSTTPGTSDARTSTYPIARPGSQHADSSSAFFEEEIKQMPDDGDDADDDDEDDGDEDDEDDEEEARMEKYAMDNQNPQNCFSRSADVLHQQLQPPPFPVGFPFSGDSSVKLASLGSTDVAVAQFAENNILPVDITVLNVVLFNLQQQQLFQMHLLQQLQRQLVQTANGAAALPPLPGASLPPGTGFSSFEEDPQPRPFSGVVTASLTTSSITSSITSSSATNKATVGAASVLTSGESNNGCGGILGVAMDGLHLSNSATRDDATSAATVDTSFDHHLPLRSTTGSSPFVPGSVTPIAAIIGMSTRSIPFLSDQHPEHGGSLLDGGSKNSDNKTSGFGQSSRNCCRFCQKIFSSDSALQIHIRSHTGERPFKCSVCGNRFSTKGNLKVHFRCHTDTYVPLTLDQKPHPFAMMQTASPLTSGAACPAVGPRPPTAFSRADEDITVVGSHLPSGPVPGEISTSPTTNGVPSKWQRTMVEDLLGSQSSTVDQRLSSENSGDAGTSEAQKSSSVVSEAVVVETKPSLSLSSPPTIPLTVPPPPLSLLSSMSSSFPSFPAPLFSSFSATRRSVPSTDLPLTAPLGIRPFGFGAPHAGLFGGQSLHSKKTDPLEQFMEVQKSEPTKMSKFSHSTDKKLSDPNQCEICYRTLSCKSALQMHYRTHTGERPFRCKICGRAFTTKGNLKTHMGVHRAKPPVRMLHQCPICHKQFTNALVLQQHIRMHTGEFSKQLAFHPPGMMIVPPPTMGYLPPFHGYPFYHSAISSNQQPALLIPAQTDEKRSLYENIFHKKESEEIQTKEESEMDELSKTRESSPSPSSSSSHKSSIFSHQRNCETEYMEVSRSSSPNRDEVDAESHDGNGHSFRSEIDQDNNKDASQASVCRQENDCDISRQDSETPDHTSRDDFSGDQEMVPAQQESGGGARGASESESRIVGDYFRYEDYTENRYSSSLMALEEKVNEIDADGSSKMSHPLQQMERIIRRTENIVSLHSNHARSSAISPPDIGNERLPSSSAALFAKSSNFSPEDKDENTGFMSGSDKTRHSFAGVDLSPKAFEAATGKPNTTCTVCYKTFACRSALDIHYRSHTKERPFRCRLCERAFSTKGNMKQHMMTHKGNNDNTTQILFGSDCSSSSNPMSFQHNHPEDDLAFEKSDSSLQSGPRTPPGDDPNDGQGAKVEAIGVAHNSTTPKLPKVTYDDHRNRLRSTSPSPSSMSRRSALRHLCSVCQKPFSSASALQIHMRTHTGDRPFNCTVCNKAFTTKGNLKVHMGTHLLNNGPSRRGRRMSVEGVTGMTAPPKANEFFCHPSRIPSLHELYHFPFHGFHARFGSPKLNEIAVFPKINGTMQHLLPDSVNSDIMNNHLSSMLKPLAFPLQASPLVPPLPLPRQLENSIKSREESAKSGSGGEGGGFGNPWPASEMMSPLRGSNGELDLRVKKLSPPTGSLTQSWTWRTSCSLCNTVCSSPGALDLHMKTHSEVPHTIDSPKSVVA